LATLAAFSGTILDFRLFFSPEHLVRFSESPKNVVNKYLTSHVFALEQSVKNLQILVIQHEERKK
jgi:hypothetical protein